MAWDLEGLIAGLLLVISCAGEKGSSVHDLLEAIYERLRVSPDDDSNSSRSKPSSKDHRQTNLRAASRIWIWLVQRPDVSIGPDRKYNHLSLEQILATSQTGSANQNVVPKSGPEPEGDDENVTQNGSSSKELKPPQDMRIFVSEDTMWQSITGHGIDYKRVPRSEWLCLLGIASTKTSGILQGDLGRLVDQDKRSVPKRTDVLCKKGYITKRTTLVRGTKTSKMWLNSFAPALVEKREDDSGPVTAGMDLSHGFLTANLDPVPWHTRWTGESVDYIALATTILAIAKAWDVIRIQDMKAKLGVLGMRWQMRVISKTCRFLNAKRIIQYVAARLDEKLFKDCIKFLRDMSAEDWAVYLATGKRGPSDALETPDGTLQMYNNLSLMATRPRWSPDEPLPQYILRMVRSSSDLGLTNPEIYFMSLGSASSRFMSSMTSLMTVSAGQSRSQGHLQLRSEHARAGKIASYRYFLQEQEYPQITTSLNQNQAPLGTRYGFETATKLPGIEDVHSLSKLCKPSGKYKNRGRPKIQKKEMLKATPAGSPNPTTAIKSGDISKPSQGRTEDLVVTLKISKNALRSLSKIHTQGNSVSMSAPARDDSGPATTHETEKTPSPSNQHGTNAHDMGGSSLGHASQSLPTDSGESGEQQSHEDKVQNTKEAADIPSAENITSTEPVENNGAIMPKRGRGRPPGSGKSRAATPAAGRGRGKGRGRGRGRGRGGGIEAGHLDQESESAAKPWVCEKCGGSWKNDLGLKYHLEKSRTACNPSFDPSAITPQLLQRARREVALQSAANERHESDGHGVSSEDETTRSVRRKGRSQPAHSDRSTTSAQTVDRRKTDTSDVSEAMRPATANYSKKVSRMRKTASRKSQDPRPFSRPSSGPGLLLSKEGMQTHRVSDLSLPLSSAPIVASPITAKASFQSFLGIGGGRPESSVTEADRSFDSVYKTEDAPAGVNPQIAESSMLHPNQITSQDRRLASSLPEGPPSKAVSRQERKQRISNFVDRLLSDGNGVFPGGEAMTRTLRMAWDKEYPSDTAPTTKECHLVLKSMASKGDILEHLHAFRGRNGAFSKCQVITWPPSDAFWQERCEMIEKIKATHPKAYIPDHVFSEQGLGLRLDEELIYSRRPLPNTVSVLDAPVYAAQVAAKRELEEAEDDRREGKIFNSNVGGGLRWVSDTHSRAWEDLSQSEDAFGGHPAIHFLDPGEFLGEDEPPGYGVESAPKKYKGPSRTPKKKSQQQKVVADEDAPIEYHILPPIFLRGSSTGVWPHFDARFFDENEESFALQGWLPDSAWFSWSGLNQAIDKKVSAGSSQPCLNTYGDDSHRRFMNRLAACVSVELAWAEYFVDEPSRVVGLHNIFIDFPGSAIEDTTSQNGIYEWPANAQMTLANFGDAGWSWESDSDQFEIVEKAPVAKRQKIREGVRRGRPARQPTEPHKSVALVRRQLTALPQSLMHEGEEVADAEEVLTAIVIVRTLLGGIERSIDWGLLMQLFPDVGLDGLRKIWVTTQSTRGAHIAKFSHDFREKFIAACENDEVAMIDFDDPLDYDWATLIKWSMQISGQEDVLIPHTLEGLHAQFTLLDDKAVENDWREKYFHVQTSTFGRLEMATTDSGAVAIDMPKSNGLPSLEDVARSWMRSLCCSGQMAKTPEDIREALLALVPGDQDRVKSLLQKAVDKLTSSKIIHRIKQPDTGDRRWQVTEWYVSTIAKLSQWSKYQEASAFKARLDASFQRGEPVKIPYTADEGTVMALINMSAHGRIHIQATDVPHVPFGFEPGNYLGRKFPKSYYYFDLLVVPSETYLYNGDIEPLKAAVRQGPPLEGPGNTVPQWIDFSGRCDLRRWCEILGAVCFIYSTRGEMTLDTLCSALQPVLEDFEARIIMEWGEKTGVLEKAVSGQTTTIGEWWWLAVPWQLQH